MWLSEISHRVVKELHKHYSNGIPVPHLVSWKNNFHQNHRTQWLHLLVRQISVPSNTLFAEQQQKCGCNNASSAINIPVNSSLGFTVVSNVGVSVGIYCLKVTCLIAISCTNFSSKFCSLSDPGHSVHSWKEQFWGKLHIITTMHWWYVDSWELWFVISLASLYSSINLPFWLPAHTDPLSSGNSS